MPRVDSGWWLVIPLVVTGAGLGLLVSQLNNYTLAPVEEERVSEAAGVNGGLGFVNSLRMVRLPDIKPSAGAEQAGLG